MTMEDSWKFSQCFGDKGDIENVTEADIISTVEFNYDGNFLATGDKGGYSNAIIQRKSTVVSTSFSPNFKVMTPSLTT